MTELFGGPPDLTPAVAIVQQADETEQQLIERAASSVSGSAWEVGECALLWTQRYANGRTDEAFADRIGVSQQQINLRRLVYQAFADVYNSYCKLKWSHFAASLTWNDASEYLAWAEENEATVAEMKAYRRMQNFEDLRVDADEHEETYVSDMDVGHTTTADSPETADAAGGQTAQDAPESQPGSPSVSPRPKLKPVSPEPPVWTLSQLQKLLTGVEETTGASERQKLAAWHRKRAKALDPPTKFIPPEVDEVAEYVRESGVQVDPQGFCDFYASKGWKVGSQSMKDWRAAVRNWSRRETDGTGTARRTNFDSNLDAIKGFLHG